jgi:CheY-like chemotaxis protein
MPRILRAEDDDVGRDMLQAVLERDGFEVVAVANVREALSIAAGTLTYCSLTCTCRTLVMVSPSAAACATPTRRQ